MIMLIGCGRGQPARVLPFLGDGPFHVGNVLCVRSRGVMSASRSKALGVLLKRVWSLPSAGPGDQPLVIDVDSTICEVSGKSKEGACYGHTRVLGYHPLVAARADTGDVLFIIACAKAPRRRETPVLWSRRSTG